MKRLRIFAPFALVAAVFVAYGNVYGNAFLYDDEFLIQKNLNIRSWDGIERAFLMSSTGGAGGVDSFYRPLQSVLYNLVYHLFGLSTTGFHLLNICLHAANAVLLFALALRLGFGRRASWFAALLWSLHPLYTEAVTYQSATADTLYTLFLLAGLLVLLPKATKKGVAIASIFYIAGLLSKETAIVFPALVCVCLFRLRDQRWRVKTYLSTAPFWLIAAGYLAARKTFLNFDNTFHFYKTANLYTEHVLYRTYTFLATLPSYLSLLVWPRHLHMERDFAVFTVLVPPVWMGLILIGVGVFAIWKERNSRRPVWAFAFLWFIVADLPQMGVFLPVNAFFLEHWLYLPAMGFFLAGPETLFAWARLPWRITATTLSGIAVALGIATFLQNEVWATPIGFYENILRFERGNARVENNLGMAYSDVGNLNAAITHYENAIRISDTYAQTHHNLALALIRKGQVDAAIAQLERALEIDKDFYHSAGALAQIYHQRGDQKKAEQYSRRFEDSFRKFRH